MQTKLYYPTSVVHLTSWAIIQELYSTMKALDTSPKHVDALTSKPLYTIFLIPCNNHSGASKCNTFLFTALVMNTMPCYSILV